MNPVWRRLSAGILGTLAVLAGIVASEYASMSFEDFSNPIVPFYVALLGTGLMWLLTLGAFGMGVHFLKHCFTGMSFRINPWLRAFLLGVLSFFPGFILSAAPALFLVSRRWPRNSGADEVAMLISAVVGVALAVLVCVSLVRKARRNHAASAIVK